jgi:ATP-dependent DNA helicase RecG
MQGKNYTGLVIGDVGSGKTFVAFLSVLGYIANSDSAKAVILAPTEILAFQHYNSLLLVASRLNIHDVDLIYVSAKAVIKNSIKLKPKDKPAMVSQDKKTIIIGTHSVLNLNNLNIDLVIVDEQHRFGVNQRNSFANYPHHFVSMTATPIPRSLALSLFAKLDTHFLDRLQGRSVIQTNIKYFEYLFSNEATEIIEKNYLNQGAKVYIVCPQVTLKDNNDGEEKVYTVEEVLAYFELKYPDQVIGLTGKDKDKKEKLQSLKEDKSKKIIVATSVIEVGIDVEEARLIIILNAERFGLAALHQLRGRVGRNNYNDNACWLVIDKKYSRSKRLDILCKSSDGFEIAQKDLELRGSGELIGGIQSGFSDEIDTITKSQPEELAYLQEIVKSLNSDSMSQLPRLNKYIESRLKGYHGE